MSEKEDRKEFVEPELTKFEDSLDDVTMQPPCAYDLCTPG